MRSLDVPRADAAEALYALAYAHEMLGEVVEARTLYETALFVDPRHAKAAKRLAELP
jgi:Flp pilus assembly protein TadD